MDSPHWKILWVFSTTLLVMSVYESGKQFAFGDKLSLWQSHVMTILFTSALSSVISWVVWRKLELILFHQKTIEVREERSRTHQATMSAAHHYLNNALNQLQLVQVELEDTGTVDPQTVKLIGEAIKKSSHELRELGEMDDATRENISRFIRDRL